MALDASQQKWVQAVLLAVLFLVIANPVVFRLVKSVTGLEIADHNGCPNQIGVVAHAIVFLLLARALLEADMSKMSVPGSEPEPAPGAPAPGAPAPAAGKAMRR